MDQTSKGNEPGKGQKHWSEPGGSFETRPNSDTSTQPHTAFGSGTAPGTSTTGTETYRSGRSESSETYRGVAGTEEIDSSVSDRPVWRDTERSSWRDMTRDLLNDVSTMFRTEGELIRTEMNEKTEMVKTGLTSIGTGSGFLLVGLFSLAATAIILLDLALPLWLSAVIVTAVFLIVGAALAAAGKKKLEGDKLAPRRSIETMGAMSRRFKDRVSQDFRQDYKENSYENRLH